jgi:hydroxyacylglutathione hydrolase
MIFERIESEGLAHYSYLIGDNKEALVIDPRRDCEVYINKAHLQGYKIKYVLETHRNEDYVVGSVELAMRTGAEIYHADSELNYKYGESVESGQIWKIGRLKIKAISSPGHTPGSMSYLLHAPDGVPWILFTGDALFAGDVGRVDLLGMDRAEELATKLYETIFKKFLPLGDDIIICPAHGSGSVCGGEIAERVWTTIGLEKKLNPKLRFNKSSDFISNVAKELERPPYFRKMELLNVEGPPILGNIPIPLPLNPAEFEEEAMESFILDSRMELGFGSAHVPNALSIWKDGLPNFAGWFMPYDEKLLLVNETDNSQKVVRYLIRLGYDKIYGSLSGGMLSWHMAGKNSSSIKTTTVQNLCHKLDEEGEKFILDVRSSDEVRNKGEIKEAKQIHITQLPERIREIPKDKTIFIFCGSGLRSMIAASFLKKNGWGDLVVVLGGLAGWSSNTCPVEL